MMDKPTDGLNTLDVFFESFFLDDIKELQRVPKKVVQECGL